MSVMQRLARGMRLSPTTIQAILFIAGVLAMSVALALVFVPAGLFFGGFCTSLCTILYVRAPGLDGQP